MVDVKLEHVKGHVGLADHCHGFTPNDKSQSLRVDIKLIVAL